MLIIYNLVPNQIINLIEKLQDALKVIKHRKQTISKVAHIEKKEIICPKCRSSKIIKNGHTKTGIQTYKCKDCNGRFNDLTHTIFARTHLSYEQIEIFLQCFNDQISIRKTAKRMGVSKTQCIF